MGHAVPQQEASFSDRTDRDQYVVLRGATWADYQRLQAIRGEKAVPRLTYLQGVLEIMSPSRSHETIKSIIGRLVEAWCLEHDVEFSAYGSWTIENKQLERGAEPDECYVFGQVAEPSCPDLAIEVVWTSGGINKLEIYRKLGVREVWYWKKSVIQPYILRGSLYEAAPQSEVLPHIDLQQLAQHLDHPTTSQAIKAYRATFRAK